MGGGKGERARGREKGMRDTGRERDRKERRTEERREKEKKKKKRWRKRGRKEGRQPTCHLLRIPAQFLERWSSNGLIYTKVLMAYSGYALQRSIPAAENSRCKGLQVEMSLVYLRKRSPMRLEHSGSE